MSCNCDNNSIPYYNECPPDTNIPDTGCLNGADAECITYTGSDLSCIGITTGMKLDEILPLIDSKVCSSSAGWGNFNVQCLKTTTGGTITSFQGFVEGISKAYCDFINTTSSSVTVLETNLTTVTGNVNTIMNPTLTLCSYIGLTGSVTHSALIQAYANKICDLNNRLTLTGVNWGSCYTVGTIPTTITGGFNLLISQICAIKAAQSSQPSTDQYVKVDSTDTTAGYLTDKLKVSSCLNLVPNLAHSNVTLGLNFQPRRSIYDVTQFDYTLINTVGSCEQQYSVSIKPEVLAAAGGLTCQSVDDVFALTGDKPVTLLGKDVEGVCIKAAPCQVREMLFGDKAPGNYVIKVSTGQDCNVELVDINTINSGSCSDAWVSLVPTMGTTGAGGSYTWTASAGGVDSVAPGTNPALLYPMYRWKNGNLEFRGSITVNTINTLGNTQFYSFLVPLAQINMSCAGGEVYPQEKLAMYKSFFESDTVTTGDISAMLMVDVLGGIGVKIKVNKRINVNNHTIVVPLSGSRFNY